MGLGPVDGHPLRRLYPVRDDATPLYVQEQGAFVGISKQRLIVKKSGEELASAKLQDVAHLVLCGNIQVSTPRVATTRAWDTTWAPTLTLQNVASQNTYGNSV